ncbi:MAG: amidohydrolase family protein [Steroidobacteraceae bacterium]|nr:amidohydrolase family protein [Steroidobacteraceae bacterium]
MRHLALLGALALAGVAQAGTTYEYTVLHSGRPSGAQTTVIGGDGTVRVSYSHRDNGRGPDLEETFTPAADGTFHRYRLRGRSTFGALLDERFDLGRGRARWQSASERGTLRVAGPAIYVPVNGSPEARAMLARAALAAPGKTIAALPGGELRAERVRELRVADAGGARDVALVMITGLGLEPAWVWLEAAGTQRLFARISAGGAHVIARGFEQHSPELERVQGEAETAQLRRIGSAGRQSLPGPVLIRNVRPFDTATAALAPPSDVYLHLGRIAAVYPAGSPAQQAATVIEGGGRALLPGLFDMHTHEDGWNAALQLAGGVTTSRDMGNDNPLLERLMAGIEAGELAGPRIVPAGYIEGESPFSSRGGFVVGSVEQARDAVDWYAQRGYRQIKLYNSIRPEWVAPIAAHAHARGLRVSGHVPAFSRSERVVREGYDELQHINQVMLNFVSDADTDSRTLARFTLVGERTGALDLDSQPVRDYIALLASRGTVVDATLNTFEAMYNQRQGEMDPALAAVADHVPFATQRDWRSNSMEVNDGNIAAYRASWAKMVAFVGRLHAAGVPLVAGTDNTAGFALHRELELYVQAGIPPGEAIRIATLNGARYTGLEGETGRIAPGLRADLILVDGDPARNISDIRRIAYVLKGGEGYSPAAIYEALGVRRFADPPRITAAGN